MRWRLRRRRRPSSRSSIKTGSRRSGPYDASAAAKTRQLGYHDQETEDELVPDALEVENGLNPRVTLRSLL